MRKFRNLPKQWNDALANDFSNLLKLSDDCKTGECSWVALTVFDHWLYETDSFDQIKSASEIQKKHWDSQIHSFLRSLVEVEIPLGYRALGRWPNKRLQFREYVGSKPMTDFILDLFAETYDPNLAFEKQKFHIFFEDNWIIYIIYKDVTLLNKLLEIANDNDLYFLPVYSQPHLNQYFEVEQALSEAGLNKAIHRIS